MLMLYLRPSQKTLSFGSMLSVQWSDGCAKFRGVCACPYENAQEGSRALAFTV